MNPGGETTRSSRGTWASCAFCGFFFILYLANALAAADMRPPLVDAAKKNDRDAVRTLLKQPGINVNAAEDLRPGFQRGEFQSFQPDRAQAELRNLNLHLRSTGAIVVAVLNRQPPIRGIHGAHGVARPTNQARRQWQPAPERGR